MAPQILKRESDGQGNVLRVAEPRPLRTVISEETAATMRTMLTAVVDSGTARKAHLPWSSVAGKTGTAQKFDTVLHTYKSQKYLASFVGLLPADRPRLVCVVMVDEPKNGYYGGDIAAPVFRNIMEDLYRLRGGPLAPAPERVRFAPPRPRDVAVPGVRTLPIARAREALKDAGLRIRIEGDGRRVLAQVPAAGARAKRGTVVVLATRPRRDVVPDVTGLTARDAITTLAAYGLKGDVQGRGLVVRQAPVAGVALGRSSSCLIVCEERTALASVRGAD
jgi:stage V sporulation protein D (sporulation-specific penicillin-binding protein)